VTDIDLHLVREFFELNLFQVMTHWHQESSAGRSDSGIQLFVRNTNPVLEDPPETVLTPTDLVRIDNAVVEIRAWHTDRFYSSVIESNPVVTQFVQADALTSARDFFGGAPFRTVLVISELPSAPERRHDSIRSLREAGVQHILEFTTILRELVQRVNLSSTYAPSHTLQMIQLLKRYRMLQNLQMEFSFPMEAPAVAAATIETAESSESEED